ncbi:MAG: flagellar basal body-associated FliL family protein [Mariprofundales bacterium]|nr:flagellar basal body-associated FliL family protein [Mariprofundales bacterium]
MADEEAGATKSGGILPLINMVLLVLVLGVGGFVAWKVMQLDTAPAESDKAPAQTEDTTLPEAEAEADNPDAPPIFIDMKDITVNLADPDVSRFLRAKIKLEVRSEESQGKIEAAMVKINDLIITNLTSKTFKELRTPQGKYKLKEELIYRINQLVGGKPVKGLYFTEFVSQ